MTELNIPMEQIDEVVLDGQLRVIGIYYKKEENNSLKQDIYNMRKSFFEDDKEFERLLKENEELKEEVKTLKYRLSSDETE